jgi:flagellar M-ring protein FliF
VPSFVQSLLALPARTKGVLAVSTVAVIGVAFLLLRLASAPSYELLSSGLDPAQTGKVTAALDAQGIGYELRNNGTALAVDKAQVGAARVALATQGVSLSGGQDGYSLFDNQKLGASQFQQQVTYQRALEGEIANTINGVSGVSNAQVQLVLPKDDLFADTATPATAAVMLGNPADTLQPGAVNGIAQIVASSVQGLKSDKVTITDSTGQLLWPAGDATGGADGSVSAGATKQAAEARFDASMEARLNAMLAQTLGPGKAQVQVNADLNVDRITRHELVYSKKGVPEEQTTDKEKLSGGSVKAGGTAGAGANIPAYSTGGSAGGAGSKYQHTVKTAKNALNKRITETDVAPGAINGLNVALVLDKSVPAATANSIKSTVASAAGINAKRGDVIQLSQYQFAKPATPKAGPVPTSLLGPIKWIGLGLASLVFLFFMRRGLKRREGEAIAKPAWLTEIEEPVSVAALEGRTQVMEPEVGTITLPPREPDAGFAKLDQLMEREPERVAAQVRQWMAED